MAATDANLWLFSQAYVLFKSPQAATAAKQKIESFGDGQQYSKKFTVSYTNPYSNPFRTLPKDGPMRNNAPASNNRSTSGAYGGTGAGGMSGTPQHHGGFNNSSSGGYRGNRGGGYNPRGGSGPGYNRGGFHQPATGGYGSNMGGFQMGGMQSYGAFQNRGAMMGAVRGGAIGIRGGRGGVAPNGMMGMPMAGMGMGAMGGMGMSMPQMGGGIGIQGMQRFYNSPPVNAVGRYGSSANPVGLFPPAQPPANQHPPVASAASPLLRGGLNPPTNVAPGSAWANYTQYSSSPASNPPASFPSHAAAPGTAITPAQPSSALKRKSSLTGNQTHYNPAFFAQQQQGQHNGATGDVNWNPHGAKRTRQE